MNDEKIRHNWEICRSSVKGVRIDCKIDRVFYQPENGHTSRFAKHQGERDISEWMKSPFPGRGERERPSVKTTVIPGRRGGEWDKI